MKTNFKLIVAAVALMPTLFFGQASFDKFEQDVNYTTVTVNKKAFSMLAEVKAQGSEKEIQEVKELAKKIESFKVIVTEKQESVAGLKSATDKYIKSAGLDELMRVKEKGAEFKVMVKEVSETKISEILIFVQDADKKAGAVTVIVKGLFDLDELTELTEKVLPKATNDSKIDAKLSDVKDALVLKVSPNPASGVFYINATSAAEVKLYDATGRLVKTQTYTADGISTAGIAPGTYVVEITTDGRRQTERIVIK